MATTTGYQDGLISVIIPCFNYAGYLPEALESLRAQTCPDWEAIVIDNGSTDDTFQVAEGYARRDRRIRCLRQEQKGPSAARNTGLVDARGEFVQFLDADDLLEPRKFELQRQHLREHPEVDLVYGGARYFTDQNPAERRLSLDESNRPWMPNVSGRGEVLLEHLLQANIMVISSPLLRRRLLERSGAFDENLSASEDWDLWLRCALQDGSFDYLERPATLTLIRVHRTSYSKDPVLMFSTALELLARHEPAVRSPRLRRLMRKAASTYGLQLAYARIRRGDSAKGLGGLVKFSWLGGDVKSFLYGMKLLLAGDTSAGGQK